MTAFFVVSTQWPEGTLPNSDLNAVLMAKAREMVDAGKLVKGTLPHAGVNTYPSTYSNATHPERGTVAKSELQAFVSNLIIEFDDATQTVHGRYPAGEPQKLLRIFTTEAAANEWCEFVLQYGAFNALILTPEEANGLVALPADDIIQQYVTQV
jgi:hypothetical protein